ncbi:MAG: VWA domain-containing protein [Candidatus Diapherotrites archaeon]
MHKIIGMLLVLALIFPAAYALEINGNCDNSITQCELGINDLEVCNNSTQRDFFNVTLSGEAAKWVTVLPSTLELGPGECRQIQTFTVSACYTEPGTYGYTITVSDGFNASINCELEIIQGHIVPIKIMPSYHEAAQCEEKIYSVELNNTSIIDKQQTEDVFLSLHGELPEEWAQFSETELKVKKGSPKTVELKVKSPCNAEFKEYDFIVRAALFNPNFFDEDNAVFEVKQAQNLVISSESNAALIACKEEKREYFLNFRNNGKYNDEYELNLDGPEWVQLERDTVSIQAGTSKDVKLILNKAPKEKEISLKVKAVSEKYNYETTKLIDVKAMDCYSLKAELIQGANTACAEVQETYEFEVTNTSIEKRNIELEVKGLNGDLEKNALALEAGETQKVTFRPDLENLPEEGYAEESDITSIEFIMDTSGSMIEKLGGEKKIDIAKRELRKLIEDTASINAGLRVFGQGISDDCAESQLTYPIEKLNTGKMIQKINSLSPQGKTPLAQALNAGANDFTEKGNNAIILVSDGKETCNGNIDEAIKTAKEKGVRVYTVGFDIDEAGQKELKKIASETGGKYFDAVNAEELAGSLNEIARELKIVKSKSSAESFTFKAKTEFAEASKKINLTVNDCFNAALSIPELALCKGIEKKEFFKIANLGTEKLEFEVSSVPEWIKVDEKFIKTTVLPEEEKEIPFTALAPINAIESEYTITVNSENQKLKDTKEMVYLSDASCIGVDLITLIEEIDAKVCEGKDYTIYIENTGQTNAEVTVSSNKSWVYVINDKITLTPGERKEVTFFVSPPFDVGPYTELVFNAKTDKGFESSVSIGLIKTGQDFEEEIDLQIKADKKIIEITDPKEGATVEFELENNSNRVLKINSITSLKYDAKFNLEKTRIAAKERTKVSMQVIIPEGEEGTIVVPFKITTNQGTYVRDIPVEFKITEAPQTEEQPISIGSGLFSLVGLSGVIIGLILLILLAVGSYYYIKQKKEETKKEQEETKTEEPKEPAEAKAKKKTAKKETKKTGKKKN